MGFAPSFSIQTGAPKGLKSGTIATDRSGLIDRPKAADLPDLTARHRETARALGLDLTLTGPWPAYGFTPEAADVG